MEFDVAGRSQDDGPVQKAFKGKQLVFVGWDFCIRSSFCCLQASSCEFECERWSHCVPCRYAVLSIKNLHIMILSYHMALHNQLQLTWELICRVHAHKPSHALSYRSNPTAQSYILNSKQRLPRCGILFWIPFPKVKSYRDVTDVLCRKNISLFYFILLESPRARGLGMSSCHGWCVRGFGFPLTFDQGVDASPCARRVSWKVANCVQPQRWMQEDAQDFKLGSQTIWVYVTWLYNVIHRFV